MSLITMTHAFKEVKLFPAFFFCCKYKMSFALKNIQIANYIVLFGCRGILIVNQVISSKASLFKVLAFS